MHTNTRPLMDTDTSTQHTAFVIADVGPCDDFIQFVALIAAFFCTATFGMSSRALFYRNNFCQQFEKLGLGDGDGPITHLLGLVWWQVTQT